jgi:hypothetical protein
LSCYVSLRSFWVQCCDVCYDFRITMIFDSSLLPVVSHRSDVLISLFLFFLRIVVSSTYCVVFCFSSSYCQFLWIVHFWLSLQRSLTFILYQLKFRLSVESHAHQQMCCKSNTRSYWWSALEYISSYSWLEKAHNNDISYPVHAPQSWHITHYNLYIQVF